MGTIVSCTATTEHQAQLIREELRQLGYNECFEERIDMRALLMSVRLRTPSEKALILEALQRVGVVEISTWEERAA